MVRYILLSLLFCTKIFASLAEMACSSSSIECYNTRSGYASDAYYCNVNGPSTNLFCYILNDNTQLIKSQLKDCSSRSNSFTQICLVKNYTSIMVGNLIIDVDLPANIAGIRVINAIAQDSFRITTSAENSFLTSLSFYGNVNIENETIFNCFVNLTSLHIIGNIISDEIPSFTNLQFLTYLYSGFHVTGNTKLDSSMVSGLENLVGLYIWNSNFHEITLNAFQNLYNLTALLIFRSPLTQLQNGVFDSLTNLKSLRLDLPFINQVGNNVFKDLNQLELFTLYNSLNFPLESLVYARGLKSLYLGYGSTSTLDPFLFQQLKRLTYLGIYYNSILCGCNLEWIPKLAQQGVEIQGSCSFPNSALRMSITSSSLYINCPQTESYKCFDRNITCPSNEFCYNTGDCYNCSCAPGYARLNTGRCVAYSECRIPNQCEYSCTNTNGSYYCSCNEGFRISANGYSCVEINECQVANGGCEGGCRNTVGSFKCYCEFGYRIYNKTRCSVINEFEMLKISIASVLPIGITVAGVIFSTLIVYIIFRKMKRTNLKREHSIYAEIGPYGVNGMQMQNVAQNYPNQSNSSNPSIEIHANPMTAGEKSKQSETKARESGHNLGRKIHIDSEGGKLDDYYGQVVMEHRSLPASYEAISNEVKTKRSDIAATEVGHNSRNEFFVDNDEGKTGKLYEQVGAEHSSLPAPYEAISNEQLTKRSDIAATEVGHNSSESFVESDEEKTGKLYEQVGAEYSSLPAPYEAISNEQLTKRSDIAATEVGHNSSESFVESDEEKTGKLYEQVGAEHSSLPAPYEAISNEQLTKRSDIAATEVGHNSSESFVESDEEKTGKLYEQVGAEYSSLPAPYEAISNEQLTKRSDIAATEVGDNSSESFVESDEEKTGKLYEQVGAEYSSLPAPYEAISNEQLTKRSDIAATEVGDNSSESFVESDEEKTGKLYEQVGAEYSSLPGPIPDS